jgi:hypothetical protein
VSAYTDLSYNKIGDSTKDTTHFVVFVGHFLSTYFFHYQPVSESVRDPYRLSRPISSLKTFVLFQNFS